MEQLPISVFELLQIVGHFSAWVIIFGSVFQLFFIYYRDRKLSLKSILIVLLTQLIGFVATIWLWLKWPPAIKILYGPILFPATISDILIMPVMLNLFGYQFFKKKEKG